LFLTYSYAFILVVQGLIAERWDGSWKYTIAKGLHSLCWNRNSEPVILAFFPQQNANRKFGSPLFSVDNLAG
jgi:hypothetical protein